MNEELELILMNILTYNGTARSCYVEAIEAAREGDFERCDALFAEGDEAFSQGHHTHAELIGKEANGQPLPVGLIMIHAEDQMMSAETLRIVAGEFIALYRKTSAET